MARRFVAEDERTDGFIHVVLITTGSVASIKAPLIVAELLTVRQCSARWLRTHVHLLSVQFENVKVEVVATEASLSLYSQEEIEDAGVRVWRDRDEWGPYVGEHTASSPPHILDLI